MPKFERQVEVDSPVEKTWKTLTDVMQWPKWFPGIDGITKAGALVQGGIVEFTRGEQPGRAAFVAIEPGKRLEVLTQVGDDKDSHVFTLRSSGGFLGLSEDECKVEYKLDTLVGGGLLGSFIAGGNPVDAIRVKKAMVSFRKLVESV